MMLFPAVLMNFPNSKVCLIGEWSIHLRTDKLQYLKRETDKEKLQYNYNLYYSSM